MPVIGAVLCAVALLPDLPYGFFVFLRWWVFSACAVVALFSFANDRSALGISAVALAIVFNPLVKIHLGRDVWWYVDLAMIPFLIFCSLKLHVQRLK
jgi:hypothetical protein